MKSENKYWWFMFASAVVSCVLAALLCSCSGDNATGGSDAVVASEVGVGDGLATDNGADATSDAVGQDSTTETASNDGSADEAGDDAPTCKESPFYQQTCGAIAANAVAWKSPGTYLACPSLEKCPADRPNELQLKGDSDCVSCWDDCYAKWLPLVAGILSDPKGKAVDIDPDVPYKELSFHTEGLGADMQQVTAADAGIQKAWQSVEMLRYPRFFFPGAYVAFSQCTSDYLYGKVGWDNSGGFHVVVEIWITQKDGPLYIKKVRSTTGEPTITVFMKI